MELWVSYVILILGEKKEIYVQFCEVKKKQYGLIVSFIFLFLINEDGSIFNNYIILKYIVINMINLV